MRTFIGALARRCVGAKPGRDRHFATNWRRSAPSVSYGISVAAAELGQPRRGVEATARRPKRNCLAKSGLVVLALGTVLAIVGGFGRHATLLIGVIGAKGAAVAGARRRLPVGG